MTPLLQMPEARVLFQGDSITDTGRSRENDVQLGGGYANLVAAWLTARYPARTYTFLNRGIGGNRVPNLEERWTRDCIELQPDWLSILIGINDTARRVRGDDPTPVREFEDGYRRLLDRVKAETHAGIILLEPFVLPVTPERAALRPLLDEHIDIVRRIAADYRTLYLPTDGLFTAAATRRAPAFWAGDGVHPTPAGHALIAQAWIKAMESAV